MLGQFHEPAGARLVRGFHEHGADGIIVSNHGGRSTETLRSTIECLPEVVDAAGGQIPVLVDGGFRRGTDVYKALALGARAVGIGRPRCRHAVNGWSVVKAFRRRIGLIVWAERTDEFKEPAQSPDCAIGWFGSDLAGVHAQRPSPVSSEPARKGFRS